LYVYLFGIHFASTALLIRVVYRSSGAPSIAVYACAAWLACRPFKEAINGVLDQRMDLATGSFCLIVAALFFDWARKPSRWGAIFAGVAAALAILHRPVMGVTIAGIAAIFIARALIRHGVRGRNWWSDIGLMFLPGLLFTLPWLIHHAEGLKFYYLIFNVDVGSASTVAEAAGYNLRWFGWGVDTLCGLLVVGALISFGVLRRVDWLDFAAVSLCAALPLTMLITSRSMGNILVPQIALGMPALALASLRPIAFSGSRMRLVAGGFAALLLVYIGARSLHQLGAQVAGVPQTARAEAMQMLREFDRKVSVSTRVVTGFQSVPLDTVGLASLARQEGINFQAGPSFFHPMDFGIGNEASRTITDAELQPYFAQTLQALRPRSTLLLVATADTEGALPAAHFSQTKARAIRAAVETNPQFVRLYSTSAIQGVKFDVYAIPPVGANEGADIGP
jgi:hypothetical protein